MNKSLFFDVECPTCNSLCSGKGNIFYCAVCGWHGRIEIHPDDQKLIQDFIQRNQNKDRDAPNG